MEDAMQIQLKLLAQFKRFAPAPMDGRDDCPMNVSPGTTVGDVLETLGVPPDLPKVVLVNYVAAPPGRPLQEGDAVTLFPPVAGG